MGQKANKVVFPVTLVVAVAFLSTFFWADANHAFASSGKNKPSAVSRTSAVDFTEVRIKQLQSALKITGAQKELWENVILVMRENAKDMDALTKDRVENMKTMNAVAFMKFRSQLTEVHLNQMKKFIPPFEAFYASMSDAQKKSTDTIFMTGKNGKHKMQ